MHATQCAAAVSQLLFETGTGLKIDKKQIYIYPQKIVLVTKYLYI